MLSGSQSAARRLLPGLSQNALPESFPPALLRPIPRPPKPSRDPQTLPETPKTPSGPPKPSRDPSKSLWDPLKTPSGPPKSSRKHLKSLQDPQNLSGTHQKPSRGPLKIPLGPFWRVRGWFWGRFLGNPALANQRARRQFGAWLPPGSPLGWNRACAELGGRGQGAPPPPPHVSSHAAAHVRPHAGAGPARAGGGA